METVKFRFEAYADETPVRGNTHCIGDDDFINGVEEGILDELADGNIWAWASI